MGSLSSSKMSLIYSTLVLLPLVAGSVYHPKNVHLPHPLGQGTGNDKYMPTDPSYNVNEEVYKAADKDDCHPVEEIVYDEKCIPYMEKTCYTQRASSARRCTRRTAPPSL